MFAQKLIAGMVMMAVVLMFGWNRSSQAVPIVSGGQLVGATNVVVAGVGTFDVSFEEGTCIAIFAGCDDAIADFDFNNETDATAAAQALIDQVFLDVADGLFDTDPELTTGCTSLVECQAAIPFAVLSAVLMQSAVARNVEVNDGVTVSNLGTSLDTSSTDNLVYARFTSAAVGVSEPATLALLGTGLASFVFARRRRRKSA